MRGIQVDGVRFRQLRRARGLTQRELAQLAGVGERTVRNAESGQRVRLDFLRYLTAALCVDVADVASDRDELFVALREERRVSHIMDANDAIIAGDASEYLGLVSSSVFVNAPGAEHVPFFGEFRGRDGVRTLGDLNLETLVRERPPEIVEIRSSGNFVVIHGIDWLRAIPTGKSFWSPFQHLHEFEKGRIVRIDNWSDITTVAEAFTPGP